MDQTVAVSPLLKTSVYKVFLVLGIFALLYLGAGLLVPLIVAALLALILDPIHEWGIQRGWSNSVSTAASMLLLLLFFGGLLTVVGTQGARLAENLPQIQEKAYKKYQDVKDQLAARGGAGPQETKQSDKEIASSELIDGSQATDALMKVSGVAGNFMLMLVYVALLLSQKNRLREFMLRRTPDESRGETHKTINQASTVAQKYLRGRVILIIILTILYGVGFLIVGLDYAIVIALLAATLSIIPYVGNIIGGGIALVLAMTGDGGDLTFQLYGIIITMSLAQLLESYILTPLIVGSEVSINPLTTIIAVVGFNILWGPVGAIVAIPVIAMFRILCLNVTGLHDYAYLLGED